MDYFIDLWSSDLSLFLVWMYVSILFEWVVYKLALRKKRFNFSEGFNTTLIGVVEVVITGSLLVGLGVIFPYIEGIAFVGWSEKSTFYWVSCFVAGEFIFFYSHYFSHKIRWFWNEHQVHHSSEVMNYFVGNRNGWTGAIAGYWFFAVPFVLLGFNWIDLLKVHFLILNYQFFIHTEIIKTLGPLEYVLNTPSLHRVHHATQAPYLDKNFGGITCVFDALFGTLQRELDTLPPVYGLNGERVSKSILGIVFNGWVNTFRDMARSKSLREALSCLYVMPAHTYQFNSKITSRRNVTGDLKDVG